MILVTGHKGFIGRNLVKHLEQQGNKVYGFDAVDGDPIELAKQVPSELFSGQIKAVVIRLSLRT
jgi:nucleoside-diphosphate-sugar epimerase